ncbi:MAG: S-layer homology domain-containing protein [bacterium]
MRRFLSVGLVIILAVAASALTFKDVPDDHWAAEAIYELVRLGVTNGYPDGTFRGTKNISRYETAVFIYKLAKALDAEDIAKLKEDVAALKQGGGAGSPISGSYSASWKTGNLLATGASGGVASYRLKLSTARDLGDGADVKINLDTMDYGFNDSGATATGGVLATELFDIESNLRLDLSKLSIENPIDVKVTFGPGSVQHATDATGVLPSEAGVTYVRPDTGVVASTVLWGTDVSAGYIVPGKASSGRVTTSKVTGTVGYAFAEVPLINDLRLDVTGDYYSSGMFSSSVRDMRGAIALAAPIGSKVEAAGTLGIGGSDQKTWLVKGEVALNDVWETGTVANVMVAKVGSSYINSNFQAAQFDITGFDPFMRPLTNGTVNLAGKVVQSVSDDLKLIGKGDVRLSGDYKYSAPSGRLTAQGGVLYAVAPNTSVDASYLVFQDKATDDTSDIAALGLLYQF